MVGLEHVGRHVGRQAHHRADGEVDVAREHDERLADRHQRVQRRVAEDEADVGPAEEVRLDERRDERRTAPGSRRSRRCGRAGRSRRGSAGWPAFPRGRPRRVGGGVARAAVLMRVRPLRPAGVRTVALARAGRDDRLLGGLLARERGHEAALAHDEHAVGEGEDLGQLGGDDQDGHAVAGQLGEQAVDLGLGADVDPAGRLVDDEQRRLAGQPLGQHDLLLVAAREQRDRAGDPAVLDLEALGPVGGERALGARPKMRPSRSRRPSEASAMLCAMDISMTRPCWRRSSGTKPMPAFMAAVGEPRRSARPLIATVPAS